MNPTHQPNTPTEDPDDNLPPLTLRQKIVILILAFLSLLYLIIYEQV